MQNVEEPAVTNVVYAYDEHGKVLEKESALNEDELLWIAYVEAERRRTAEVSGTDTGGPEQAADSEPDRGQEAGESEPHRNGADDDDDEAAIVSKKRRTAADGDQLLSPADAWKAVADNLTNARTELHFLVASCEAYNAGLLTSENAPHGTAAASGAGRPSPLAVNAVSCGRTLLEVAERVQERAQALRRNAAADQRFMRQLHTMARWWPVVVTRSSSSAGGGTGGPGGGDGGRVQVQYAGLPGDLLALGELAELIQTADGDVGLILNPKHRSHTLGQRLHVLVECADPHTGELVTAHGLVPPCFPAISQALWRRLMHQPDGPVPPDDDVDPSSSLGPVACARGLWAAREAAAVDQCVYEMVRAANACSRGSAATIQLIAKRTDFPKQLEDHSAETKASVSSAISSSLPTATATTSDNSSEIPCGPFTSSSSLPAPALGPACVSVEVRVPRCHPAAKDTATHVTFTFSILLSDELPAAAGTLSDDFLAGLSGALFAPVRRRIRRRDSAALDTPDASVYTRLAHWLHRRESLRLLDAFTSGHAGEVCIQWDRDHDENDVKHDSNEDFGDARTGRIAVGHEGSNDDESGWQRFKITGRGDVMLLDNEDELLSVFDLLSIAGVSNALYIGEKLNIDLF